MGNSGRHLSCSLERCLAAWDHEVSAGPTGWTAYCSWEMVWPVHILGCLASEQLFTTVCWGFCT